MSKQPRVLVVGAGPVGSIMAYALVQRGVPVVLIDQLETPVIECRAASCHPPTVAMLDDLAQGWGVQASRSGRAVWFEVARPKVAAGGTVPS